MELIPILIIVLGVVSSIISGKKNKDKEGDRNVDTSKLDRRQNTAPRNRQPETKTEEQKGFFQTLQEAFDEEFNKPDTQPQKSVQKPQQTAASSDANTGSRPSRQATERPVRDTARQSNSSKNISDIKKSITDRSAHAKRASEARDSVYTRGYSDRVTKSEGIGKDTTDDVRYSYGDDVTEMHRRGDKKTSRSAITKNDLTFDKKAVVNGFIISEILGKPKSKR